MDAKESWMHPGKAGLTLLLGLVVIGVIFAINSRYPSLIEFAEHPT